MTDDRGQDGGDALVGVDVRMPHVELATKTRRASERLDQSTVADRQQRQRHEDAEHAVQPDVDAHQTPVERLQRAWTLDQDRRRRLRTRNGLDSTI